MGCGCRGGVRRTSSRAFIEPTVTSTSTRSLCLTLESEGNNLTVRVAADGRLYLGAPHSTDLPAASLLSSAACRGSFAQAVLAANMKLSSIFLSPATKTRLQAALPSSNVKLGFLREILRTF